MASLSATASAHAIRRPAWMAAALVLFAAAVAAHATQAAIHPEWYWQQTDESVYRAAGVAIRTHQGMLYSVRLGAPALPFTYPPFAALLFAVASPFSFASWQIALAATSIMALPVIAYQSLGLAGLERGSARLAAAFALAAVSLWLEPVQKTLLFGQLNLLLLAVIMADLAAPRRHRWKGAGIGIAAGIKLTPLIFIPYLLLTGRRRAALVALVTFGVTAALGLILLPADSVAYWGGKFAAPGDGPERLVNQSIDGLVQRAMHDGTSALAVWLVLAALTFTGGLVTAAVASRRGWELPGIVVCAVTGLLISPISWTHHWVYVIPGLALLASRAPQPPAIDRATAGHPAGSSAVAGAGRMATGVIVVGLFAMWPARSGPDGYYDPRAALVPRGLLRFAPHNFGLEYRWHGLELLLGNYYVLTGAIFVIVTAGYLALARKQA